MTTSSEYEHQSQGGGDSSDLDLDLDVVASSPSPSKLSLHKNNKPSLYHSPTPKNNNHSHSKAAAAAYSLDKTTTEQLESDLSLFLSNPKLTQQLAEGSLDLLGYSAVVEQELQELEAECIAIYHTKAQDIYKLKDEIETCDTVLTSLQEMLFGFQADLGGLSSDIRLLQEQSHTLEVQLRNRKRAELLLRSFLEQIVIPPNIAQVICHKDVNATFMECVETLNAKYANVCSTLETLENMHKQEQRQLLVGGSGEGEGKEGEPTPHTQSQSSQQQSQSQLFGHDDTCIVNMDALAKVLPLPCDTQAGREMKTHIQTLRLKAVQRVREYFLVKIGHLRKPKTNVRMIQVNSLLKYAPLNAFLYDIHQEQQHLVMGGDGGVGGAGGGFGGAGYRSGGGGRLGGMSMSVVTGGSSIAAGTTGGGAGAPGGTTAGGNGTVPTDVYMEVKEAYVDSMSKTLVALFRTYHAQLLRLLEGSADGSGGSGGGSNASSAASYTMMYTSNVLMAGRAQYAAGRQDLIAVEDASLRDMFSTKVNMAKKTDTFFLGARVGVLDELTQHAPPILAHEALEEQQQFPFERLFRSILTHLMDAALNEFVFCHGFFIHTNAGENGGGNNNADNKDKEGDDGQSSVAGSVSAASASHMSTAGTHSHSHGGGAHGGAHKESLEYTFYSIFHKTLSVVVEQVENYLFHCYDCLAVLLMIKLTHASRRMMHLRHVFVLDTFFERLTQLLWPRLKIIMDAQLRSLRLATAAKLGGVELHAHYVSRRYAEFTSSVLLILNKGGGGGGTTSTSSNTQQSSPQQQQQASSRGGNQRRGSSGDGIKRASRHSRQGGGSTSTSNIAEGDNNSVHSSSAHGGGRLRRDNSSVSGHESVASGQSHHDGPMNSRVSSHSSVGGAGRNNNNNYSSHGGGGRGGGGSVSGHGYTSNSGHNNNSNNNSHNPQFSRGTAGDMLIHDLSLITQESITLLERLSDKLPNHKSRIVFLINNYDQIIQIFGERRIGGINGGGPSQEMTKFMDLLLQQRELFVEEELLSQGFSKMIAFVQQTESHMAQLASGGGMGMGMGMSSGRAGGGRHGGSQSNSSGGGAAAGGDSINEAVVEALVRDFAAHWKRGIDTINRNVLSYFSNFRNGMEILKQVLTQLLLYYTRFQDLIRKHWRHKPPAWAKDLVSTSLILAEIKKYALSI
jgi:hypothetical protein